MNEIVPTGGNNEIVAQSDDLSRVVLKALKQIETILDMDPAEAAEEDYMKLLSIKKDAASSIINAGLKADENRFRRENKDILDRLFEKIQKSDKIIDGKVSRRS